MSKRKFCFIVSVLAVGILLVWLNFPARDAKTDQEKFQRWKETMRLYGKANWWGRHLPRPIGSVFHLSARETEYLNEHECLGLTLLASGYLTNVSIAVPAVPTNAVQRAQAADRLRRTFPRNDWEF